MAISIFAMSAVPSMHEQMQQRAGEQQQPGEQSEQMGSVLGEEEKSRDRKKGQQHQSRAPVTALVRLVWSIHVFTSRLVLIA